MNRPLLIPACPNCGVDGAYVFRNRRAYGWAKETWSPSGEQDNLELDAVNYTDSETLRCEECLEVRPDIEMIDRTIELK